MKRLLIITVSFLFLSFAAYGQVIKVQTENRVCLSESINVTFYVSAEFVDNFTWEPGENFISVYGPVRFTSSSMKTFDNEYLPAPRTYYYCVLKPRSLGRFTIPEASAVVNGRKVVSREHVIEVVPDSETFSDSASDMPNTANHAPNLSNIDYWQEGRDVIVSYDIDSDVPEVQLFVSQDGGTSFFGPLKMLDGDVFDVKAGSRQMKWHVLQEVDKLSGSEIVFKLVALNSQWVDLGLSVRWASCNIGATKAEEYGKFFFWGDVVGQNRVGGSWTGSGFFKWTAPEIEYDRRGNLKMEYDAAHVNLGGSWRMPTEQEFRDLINNCTTEWTTVNGVRGVRFRSNISGYTDKSIFMPAAGGGFNEFIENDGTCGYYWSGETDGDGMASLLCFSSNEVSTENRGLNFGLCVRPVYKPKSPKKITIFPSSLPMFVDQTIQLSATILPDDADQRVTWTSSNDLVAAVSATGAVTALSAGSASITATSSNGLKAISYVKSTVPVLSVSLDRESVSIVNSSSLLLVPCISPSNTTDKSVTWSSDNPAVATVVDGVVTARSLGIANITVKTNDKGKTSSCEVTVVDMPVIDLGLSVRWATCNLGASSPEEYGNFFAWGSISGQCWNGSRWSLGGFPKTFPDPKIAIRHTLPYECDAAHAALNGSWRMPTEKEFSELFKNCTVEWTKMNGIYGMRFTSKKRGYTDRSIFLPAGGYNCMLADKSILMDGMADLGKYGGYWSSSYKGKEGAVFFYFRADDIGKDCIGKNYGRSIRPVTK